jgi:hypothetical protein
MFSSKPEVNMSREKIIAHKTTMFAEVVPSVILVSGSFEDEKYRVAVRVEDIDGYLRTEVGMTDLKDGSVVDYKRIVFIHKEDMISFLKEYGVDVEEELCEE